MCKGKLLKGELPLGQGFSSALLHDGKGIGAVPGCNGFFF